MDLKDLEERLNSDEKLRERFFADPVATLEAEGLVLPDQAKQKLVDMVNRLKSQPKAVPGATVRPAGAANEVQVSVGVGKNF